VREEDATDAEATPSSAVGSPTPTSSAVDADEDPKGMQDDNNDDLAPNQEKGDDSNGGDKVSSP
jgi:hypothetical protein